MIEEFPTTKAKFFRYKKAEEQNPPKMLRLLACLCGMAFAKSAVRACQKIRHPTARLMEIQVSS